MFRRKEKQLNEFARLLGGLDGAQIVGLTRLLEVRVFIKQETEAKERFIPRDSAEIIEECLVKFDTLKRRKRNYILRMLRAASKEK